MTVKIKAQAAPWRRAVELLIYEEQNGRRSYIKGIELETDIFDENSSIPDSSILRIEIEDAQILMDQLWNCGLRPAEGAGSAGSLRATENHLHDMQKIAFDLLKREPISAQLSDIDVGKNCQPITFSFDGNALLDLSRMLKPESPLGEIVSKLLNIAISRE